MQLPRMTTRRWMVAVALISLLLTLLVRQDRLYRIAKYHCDQAIANYDPAPHKRAILVRRVSGSPRVECGI